MQEVRYTTINLLEVSAQNRSFAAFKFSFLLYFDLFGWITGTGRIWYSLIRILLKIAILTYKTLSGIT